MPFVVRVLVPLVAAEVRVPVPTVDVTVVVAENNNEEKNDKVRFDKAKVPENPVKSRILHLPEPLKVTVSLPPVT